MIVKILIVLLLLLAAYIAFRIYSFFKATDAPILKGKLNRNVRYKKGKKLDIYLPTESKFEKIPVIVHFHGGGWLMGSKLFVNNARFHGAFNKLRESGYAIISPKYTLAKKGVSPFPACIVDAHDALAWIEKNAEEYNFDLNNIGIMGESAGAHIALMSGFVPPDEFGVEHSVNLKYIVDVYGPAEMYRLYRDLIPLLENISNVTQKWPDFLKSRFNVKENLFGFDPNEDEGRTMEFTKRFSPTEKVEKGVPQILIIHGDRDQIVPINQSEILMEKLKEKEVSFEFHLLRNVGHAFRGANLIQRGNVQKWIVEFVFNNYKVT